MVNMYVGDFRRLPTRDLCWPFFLQMKGRSYKQTRGEDLNEPTLRTKLYEFVHWDIIGKCLFYFTEVASGEGFTRECKFML